MKELNHHFQPTHQKNEEEQLLDNLFLSKTILRDVLLKSVSARRQHTANNPKTSAGQQAYSSSVRALREETKLNGYEAYSERNIELTINNELKIALYVCTGCKQTGLVDGSPQSKTKKGRYTLELFNINNNNIGSDNYDLFQEYFPKTKSNNPLNCEIWFLLHHYNKGDNKVYAELSQPTYVDQQGFVKGFKNRVIIDINDIDVDDVRDNVKPKDNFTPKIDIDLEEI